jgi:N-acyl-D-amino-acid deacylase
MTGQTADRYGIPERGYIKPGYKADLTVIDLSHMKVNESRPDFRPEGIVHVYINGKPVLQDGCYLGGKAGKVLLKNGKSV